MAIQHGGPHGYYTGRLGNTVGYISRGKALVRSCPAVKKAPSAAQLAGREKFRTATAFLNGAAKALSYGSKYHAAKRSGEAACVLGQILREAVCGEYPHYFIDYRAVKLSRGSLLPALNPTVKMIRPGLVHMEWEDNVCLGNASDNDKAVIMVYNADKQQWGFNHETAKRSDGAIFLEASAAFTGDRLHCYIFFVQADLKKSSPSLYMGYVDL